MKRSTLLEQLAELKGEDPAMTTEWLRQVSGPRLIIPELRSNAEQNLYSRIHAAFPTLGATSKLWNVEFVRELDMTNDREAFADAAALENLSAVQQGSDWVTKDGIRFLPLYEGRLVHQFDHLAKAYLGGAGRRAQWTPLLQGRKVLKPHYWVRHDVAERHFWSKLRAGFCDITGHANERTVLAAVVPPECACGNKVPTVAFDKQDARLPYFWIAVANSFVVDWALRRRVSTTLNFFHWKMTPFPRLELGHTAFKELWTHAARLSAVDEVSLGVVNSLLSEHGEPPATLLAAVERSRIRAAIDVGVAQLYGLAWPDLSLILEDFPLLDRFQPVMSGQRRSTVTRDLLHATWAHSMGEPGGDSSYERVGAAEARGAVAYVPSEQAKIARSQKRLITD